MAPDAAKADLHATLHAGMPPRYCESSWKQAVLSGAPWRWAHFLPETGIGPL